MTETLSVRVIGSAIYPTFALVNHSCDQNTYKYFAGNTVIVIASKVSIIKRQFLVALIFLNN